MDSPTPQRGALADRKTRPNTTVYASVYGPAGRRTHWWGTFRCPACQGGHFCRSKTLEKLVGPRRAGCGLRVQLVAARIYQPKLGGDQ